MDLIALLPQSTHSVTLRVLTHRDSVAYAAGASDLEVRRFGHLPEPEYTPQRVSTLIDSVIAEGLRDGSLAVLAVADRITDSFLGSLVVFDVSADSAEIGFWLAPWARGRGAATEALQAGQDLARACGLATLRARTIIENHASQRVLRRAGFRRRGSPVEGTTPAGETALVQEFTVVL